ncbi:MAG: hypothetical protein WC750_01930 [Patescibacteria group bacterium]|jgi:hypothetical protein
MSDKKENKKPYLYRWSTVISILNLGLIGLGLYMGNTALGTLNDLKVQKADIGDLKVNYSTTTGDAYFSGKIFTGSMRSMADAGTGMVLDTTPLTAEKSVGTPNDKCIWELGTQCLLWLYGQNTGRSDAVQATAARFNVKSLAIGAPNVATYEYHGTSDGCLALVYSVSTTLPTAQATSTAFCNSYQSYK